MNEYEAYQTARVEGFIPADQSFEEYLLAEVKRLRKENDELHAQRVQFSWIQEARGGQSNAFELLAEVKRLREEVYNLTRANDTAWALLKVAGEEG